MKIILSRGEVESILRDKFNLMAHDNIEIVHSTYPRHIGEVIEKIEAMGFRHDNKIQLIKSFRENFLDAQGRSIVGLADAKGIIENWQAFKAYTLKYQELPKMFYDYLKKNGGIPD